MDPISEFRDDPVILFALPRSGSTLFMRLFQRCANDEGNFVNFTGEQGDVLWKVFTLSESLRHLVHRGTSRGNPQTKWAPHYQKGNADSCVRSLASVFLSLNQTVPTQPWGFKEVNMGVGDRFLEVLSMLVHLFPSVRFVFHVRDTDDVVRSMMRNKWWPQKDRSSITTRLEKQICNYTEALSKFPERSIRTEYPNLLSHESFSDLIAPLSLHIKESDYLEVISRKL